MTTKKTWSTRKHGLIHPFTLGPIKQNPKLFLEECFHKHTSVLEPVTKISWGIPWVGDPQGRAALAPYCSYVVLSHQAGLNPRGATIGGTPFMRHPTLTLAWVRPSPAPGPALPQSTGAPPYHQQGPSTTTLEPTSPSQARALGHLRGLTPHHLAKASDKGYLDLLFL